MFAVLPKILIKSKNCPSAPQRDSTDKKVYWMASNTRRATAVCDSCGFLVIVDDDFHIIECTQGNAYSIELLLMADSTQQLLPHDPQQLRSSFGD